MNGHYFKNDSNLKSDSKLIITKINGIDYRFSTDNGVFSKRQIDEGSLTLLSVILVNEEAKTLLDLGAGYGPIGIVLKKENPRVEIVQTDINERAINLCKKNKILNNVETTCFVSDGFIEIKQKFDVITLNPPIRAGKEIVFKLYEDSYKNLNKMGELWLVIRKKQGAPSHKQFLETLFDSVNIIAKNKGYYVIKCDKQK